MCDACLGGDDGTGVSSFTWRHSTKSPGRNAPPRIALEKSTSSASVLLLIERTLMGIPECQAQGRALTEEGSLS